MCDHIDVLICFYNPRTEGAVEKSRGADILRDKPGHPEPEVGGPHARVNAGKTVHRRSASRVLRRQHEREKLPRWRKCCRPFLFEAVERVFALIYQRCNCSRFKKRLRWMTTSC